MRVFKRRLQTVEHDDRFSITGRGSELLNRPTSEELNHLLDTLSRRIVRVEDRKKKPHLCSIGQVCFAEYG